MKLRVTALLALVGALLVGAPSFAQAQHLRISPENAAETWCEADSTARGYHARSVVDMTFLSDSVQLDELRVHEAVHRRQMDADPTKCEPSPKVLLAMEVEAYCADAAVALRHGDHPKMIWLDDYAYLVAQFKGLIPDGVVFKTWWNGCGKLSQP